MILPPLRFLRAGVDSQCERTGEALVQALRDGIRLLTFFKPDADADVESELLEIVIIREERERRRCRRGLSFFMLVGQRSKAMSKVARTSTFLWMDVDPSNLADLTHQVPPTTIHVTHLPSPPTHAASTAMPYERTVTVVLGFWSLYCSLVASFPDTSALIIAGSYDNEAIAIFLLMVTFFCWIKALKQGSALFATIAAVCYFYMAAAWGRIRVHYEHDTPARSRQQAHGPVLSPPLQGYFCQYASPLRWLPAICQRMGALCGFGLLQIEAFTQFVRSHLSSTQFRSLLNVGLFVVGILGTAVFVGMTAKCTTAPWTGRFHSL